MIRWAVPFALVSGLACSDLTEGAGGVVELEIRTPAFTTIEVGEALQLSARALDRDGNSVDVPISWQTPDATVTVDPATGVITGVAPGTGRVQALAGSLASPLVSFTVIARADTLILIGDSILTVAPEATVSAPLVTQLQSFSPAGPLPSRPVVYAVTSPPDVGPHSVELPGGVLADTVDTDLDGTVQGVTLSRVSGVATPDSAIVEVRAYRTRGTEVPGSGQRFIVRFQ
ncbi:MAG: Ig-like domain-containing protein [Gemmatimonadales bacterium]